MKKKVWERRFLKALNPLSKEERKSALSYYQEMYGDKAETGIPEEEILREFGEPERCALRILREEENAKEDDRSQSFHHEPPRRRNYSAAELIGLTFFVPIILLPLAIVALALIISFGAVCVSGAIVAVAGLLCTVISPFFVLGNGGAAVLANFALGITLCGVGLLLFAGFFFLTKWVATGTSMFFGLIFNRRNAQ